MRYLITLPQDSQDHADIRAYCDQHHMDLRATTWYMATHAWQFHVLYSDDAQYVNWLQLQYATTLVEF